MTQMIKLGTLVRDNSTKIKGMLTLYEYSQGGNEHYLLHPRGKSERRKVIQSRRRDRMVAAANLK